MQKKTLLIILSSLLVVLLGVAAFLAVYMLGQDSTGDVTGYQKQLELGNKYVESGEYEQAIAAYRTAIDDDPDNDEPYYLLAGLYRQLNRMEDMKAILTEGIERTSSDRLRELYGAYFGAFGADGTAAQTPSSDNIENMDSSKDTANDEVYLSYSNTKLIANYEFEDYTVKFKNPQVDKHMGVYTYTFSNFDGSICFFNEDGYTSINEAEDAPYNNVRPNYVTLNSLSFVFDGVTEGRRIAESELSSLGASITNSQAFDNELGSYITFKYNNCMFDVAVDGDRTFGMDSANRLYSAFGTGAEKVTVVETVTDSEPEVTTTTETTTTAPQIFTNTLFIGDATTGVGVPMANVNVHEGSTVQGQIVYTTATDAEGNCTVELASGNYCVEVSCTGYIVEAFELEVYSTGVASVENLTISPELQTGEIRIVLEWGDSPRDLDSYLVSEDGNSVYFSNRSWSENGEDVAGLDVDDTDGFGPETITLYDTTKNFTYFVDDYRRTGEMFSRQDVTVKVYTSDSAAPTVYTITNSDSGAYGWCVFSYIDGEIIVRNTEIPEGRNGFTHQS